MLRKKVKVSVMVSITRNKLDDVCSLNEDARITIDKLLTSTSSRERGQEKTNERIDEHIQVK